MLHLTEMEQAALMLSLISSGKAVLWSMPLAIGLGWLLGTRRFPGHAALNAFVHLPLVLPPVVLGYLLLVLLGRNGLVGGPLFAAFGTRIAFTGEAVVIACAVVGFPLMVRAIRQAAEAMDPRLARAARSLGASETRIFATVTLPLMSPGILTGVTLAFARAGRPSSLEALTIRTDPAETERLTSAWESRRIPVPLTVLDSPILPVNKRCIYFNGKRGTKLIGHNTLRDMAIESLFCTKILIKGCQLLQSTFVSSIALNNPNAEVPLTGEHRIARRIQGADIASKSRLTEDQANNKQRCGRAHHSFHKSIVRWGVWEVLASIKKNSMRHFVAPFPGTSLQ